MSNPVPWCLALGLLGISNFKNLRTVCSYGEAYKEQPYRLTRTILTSHFSIPVKIVETMENSKRPLELDPEEEVKRMRVTSEKNEDYLKKDATLPPELDEGRESAKSAKDNKSSGIDEDKAVVWIKEEDVGISAFLGDHPGFMAFIKQRFAKN